MLVMGPLSYTNIGICSLQTRQSYKNILLMLSCAVWTPWHLVGQSILFPFTSLSIGKHKRWKRVRCEVWMWCDLCRYCCIIRAVILKAIVSCRQILPLICSLSISLHPVHLNGCFWITPWQNNACFPYSSGPMDTWVMLYCLFMSIPPLSRAI